MSVDLQDIANARGFLSELIKQGEIKDPSDEQDNHRHLWGMITFLRRFWAAGYSVPFGIGRTQRACRIQDKRYQPGNWVLVLEGADGWEGLSFYDFSLGLPYLGTFASDFKDIELKYPYEDAFEQLQYQNQDGLPTTEGKSQISSPEKEG